MWHAPLEPPSGGPVTGLLLDEWVELLPGSDQPPGTPPGAAVDSELTGVAFHYDRPDAKAPHAILVAVPPDVDRGWTSDGLLQVVRETMELATLRAVDAGDVPRIRDLLPAIRISAQGATGQALSRIETRRPNTDPDGPFRFEPGYRTDQVEAGLAARVHDPLWLLTRQWQFGEFTAQDAGSPAVVRLAGGSAPIDAWRPVGATDWVPYSPEHGPLDAQIEDEPVLVDERLRAEGGAQLLRLDDAGALAVGTVALEPHLMPAGDPDGSIVDLLGGRVPDAAAVSAALDAGALDLGHDAALIEVTAAGAPGGLSNWPDADRTASIRTGSSTLPSCPPRARCCARRSTWVTAWTGSASTSSPSTTVAIPRLALPHRARAARSPRRACRRRSATVGCPPTGSGRWRTPGSTSARRRCPPSTPAGSG